MTEHHFSQFFTQVTPGTPFVFFLLIQIILLLASSGIDRLKAKVYKMDIYAISDAVKEGLDDYFKVLAKKQRQAWIREEFVCQNRLDMTRLSTSSFEALYSLEKDSVKNNRPKLQGVVNYDILSNPIYQYQYAYIPCRYPKRGLYAISEYKDKQIRKLSFDIVRLAVDLPYLPQKRAE